MLFIAKQSKIILVIFLNINREEKKIVDLQKKGKKLFLEN